MKNKCLAKYQLCALVLLLIFCSSLKARSTPLDTTKVGIYLTSIYDLNYINNSFSAEFWLWKINSKWEFKKYYAIEATNVKESKREFSTTDWPDQTENILPNGKEDTLYWDYEKFRSVVKHEYDITKYPFDSEMLIMEFEGINYFDDLVKLQIDEKASGHSKLTIDGWRVGEMQLDTFNTIYASTFGSPGDKGFHKYSGIRVKIPIEREATALFLKLYAGIFVAFIIALFSLRINITEADGRFGVCVGALFAALANMYIVNSNLPLVSKFTFLDKAHILTIGLILVLFIASTFSLKYYKADKLKKSKRVDVIIGSLVIAVYMIGMIVIAPY